MVRALYLLAKKPRKHTTNYYTWFIGKMKERLARGKNNIVVIDGDNATGKSTASLRISYDTDGLWRSNPRWTTTHLTVFSAREWNILVAALMHAEEIKLSNIAMYRRRYLVVDEAEQHSFYLVGAIQELRKNVQVFRKWQINVVFNLPQRKYIREIIEDVASFIVWTKDFDQVMQQVIGTLKVRYRFEETTTFVHPKFWRLLETGYYPFFMANFFAKKPGAWITIPFAPQEIWELYEHQKDIWFKTLTLYSVKRIRRLGRKSDLGAYIVRPQLALLEQKLLETCGDEILEQTFNIAEKQRAELGHEDLVDLVHLLIKQNKAIIDELGGRVLLTAKHIRLLREEFGITMRELARKLGGKYTVRRIGGKPVKVVVLPLDLFERRINANV